MDDIYDFIKQFGARLDETEEVSIILCPCVFYSVLCLDILYVSDSVMYNCVTSMHSITVGYK